MSKCKERGGAGEARCSICNHPNRREIDKALVTRSASMRDIAGRFGVSRSALSRHKKNHLPRLVKAAEAAQIAEAVSAGADLIDELDRLLKRAMTILEKAEKAGELRVALQAIREARETLKTQADLSLTQELEERLNELEELIHKRDKGFRFSR